jgi:hypothetical protein
VGWSVAVSQLAKEQRKGCARDEALSTDDPVHWSGRKKFTELAVAVLHQCIRALIGAVSLWTLDGAKEGETRLLASANCNSCVDLRFEQSSRIGVGLLRAQEPRRPSHRL